MLYLGILLSVAALVGAYFYFHVHKIQVRNRNFAQKTGLFLTGSYIRPIFSGKYRGYEIDMETVLDEKGKRSRWVKLAVKMQNPNAKTLHIYHAHSQGLHIFPQEYLSEMGEVQLKDHFSAGVKGVTNDLFFSSILLTEQIKQQISQEMTKHTETLLFFQGEELAYLSPCIASFEESQNEWFTQLALLCNMKDTLQ